MVYHPDSSKGGSVPFLSIIPMSRDCDSLIQSIGTASLFWDARNNHVLYMSGGGLIFTNFSARARGKGPTKSYYEEWIGQFGSGNRFAGVPLDYVVELAPLVRSPSRVGGRRGGAVGRRPVGRGH